jgi:hypothetical protein
MPPPHHSRAAAATVAAAAAAAARSIEPSPLASHAALHVVYTLHYNPAILHRLGFATPGMTRHKPHRLLGRLQQLASLSE